MMTICIILLTEFRTGKTQLSHTMCGQCVCVCVCVCCDVFEHFAGCTVTSQLPGRNGYTGGKVVFLDTEVCMY